MTARTKRSFRRPAGLVIAFAMALSLPGVSEANHNTCTEQGSSDPTVSNPNACPEFSPGFVAHVKYPYRNTPAAINLEVSQAAGEANLLLWEWFLPRDWQFNLDIKEAETPAGAVPTKPPLGSAANCDQLFDGSNNAPRAEAVSDGNSIWTKQGSAAIVKWTSKRGMYYWYTQDYRTTLCVRFVSGSNTWTTPVYLDRVDLGPNSPYGWKVTVPVETIQQTTWWTNAAATPDHSDDYSLVTIDLEFKQKTSGLWHDLADVNYTPTSVVFSRAPRDPVQTRIGTRAWTCTNGKKTVAECTAEGNPGFLLQYPYPKDTNEGGGLAEFPFTVNRPPATSGQPFARFSRVGHVQIPGSGARFDRPVDGFGYTDGTAILPLNWNHLTSGLAPGVTVVGYALAVHKIVQHQHPTSAQEIAAGRVMFQREMNPVPEANNFSKSFDLSQMPENATLGVVDGKYDAAIVTIYNYKHPITGEEFNGYRSDGLCDGVLTNQQIEVDGAFVNDDGRGVLCPADNRPTWATANPQRDQGVGDWQVLVRKDAWPQRYYHQISSQPFQILLFDPVKKQAEFTIWGNPVYGNNATLQGATPFGQGQRTWGWMWSGGRVDQGASYSFRAGSELIYEPTGPASGAIQFGTIDLEGESHNWWFKGRWGGQGVPPANATNAGAYGIFEQYAPRGSDLDWFRPSNPGSASGWVGSITAQRGDPNRMYPETITSEFIGTKF